MYLCQWRQSDGRRRLDRGLTTDAVSYADAWLKWFEVIERGATALSQRMIELAAIEAADRVLDIGTGSGEPALTAAVRLGAEGRVCAIDRDPEMIAIAASRAGLAGISNVDFEVADIESIELAPTSLDCILARWSLMFVDDLPRVLQKLKRALCPGGRLVIAVWASAEEVPALTLARRVVREHFALPPLVYGPGTPFGLADVSSTCKQIAAAGFIDLRNETVPVVYHFTSAESYLQNRLDLTGPLWEGMESAVEGEKREAFAAIEAALQGYRTTTGEYAMTNTAICISAIAGWANTGRRRL